MQIKGDVIYQPRGQALEYAPLAANPYRGCGHMCAYCYVPAAVHMSRAEFDLGATERKDFLTRLRRDAARYQAAGCTEQVLLSFSSDPYHPGDTSLTRATLLTLAEHGLGFCTLSKGGRRVFRDAALFRPERDAYAATLTSLDDDFSIKWERTAPLPAERIAALRAMHERGIYTWVSLEPVLDVAASLDIIRATHGFVDLYKAGRANYCGPLTKQTDWAAYTHRLLDVFHQVNAAHYIKHDLQGFLPDGYHNPLRVPQHH